MGLFSSRSSNTAELLRLQKIVMKDSPDRLIMSESQLRSAAANLAKQELRICRDCAKIIETTTKPDVFFARWDLMRDKLRSLQKVEGYVSFKGGRPSEAFRKIVDRYYTTVQGLLIRSFTETWDKVETLKTTKSKLAKFQKLHDTLHEYYGRMNADNIDYVESRFKLYTERLVNEAEQATENK